ncbi:MAG: FtsQ-type POTRA domain-containing protein [Oscillospiraceae bacterium]
MDKRKKQARRQAAPPPIKPKYNTQKAQLFDQMAAPIPRTITNKSMGMHELMEQANSEMSQVQTQVQDNKKRHKRPRDDMHRISRAQARRLRNRRRLVAILIAVAVIVVGLTLSVTVLFKIDNFVLDGDSPYAIDELSIAFAHPKGENIFAFRTQDAQNAISKALPYIETVTVRRRLPGTIVFKVTQATEAYYVKTDAAFVVLSQKLKILRVSQDLPTDLIEIVGVVPTDTTQGAQLTLDSTDKYEALNKLLYTLDSEGITKVNVIDVTNELEMNVIYDNRAKIIIGTQNDLEDKLAVAKTVLENHIGALERGTLDVSHQNENEHRNGVWRAGKF